MGLSLKESLSGGTFIFFLTIVLGGMGRLFDIFLGSEETKERGSSAYRETLQDRYRRCITAQGFSCGDTILARSGHSARCHSCPPQCSVELLARTMFQQMVSGIVALDDRKG